jgi:hypothetical protein
MPDPYSEPDPPEPPDSDPSSIPPDDEDDEWIWSQELDKFISTD